MQSSMTPVITKAARWLIAQAHHTPSPGDHSAYWTKLLNDVQAGTIPANMDLATSTLARAKNLKAQLRQAGRPTAALYEDLNAKKILLLDDQYQTFQQYDRTKAGHLQAIKAVLRLAHPTALTLALAAESRHPALSGRAIRAALIVADQTITPCDEGYQVSSQQGNRLGYIVAQDLSMCRCPDWRKGKQGKKNAAPVVAGRPCCKHIIAVTMMQRLERTRL